MMQTIADRAGKSKALVKITTPEECVLSGHEFLISYITFQDIVDYSKALHEVGGCRCILKGTFPSFEVYPKDFSYFEVKPEVAKD